MLMHDSLEKEYLIAIRVFYNMTIRVKQQLREDKNLGPYVSNPDI